MENESGGVLGPREQSKERVGSRQQAESQPRVLRACSGSIDIEPGGADAHSSHHSFPPSLPLTVLGMDLSSQQPRAEHSVRRQMES